MSHATHTAGVTPGGQLSPQFQVAHHFDTADTQLEASKLGVWIFLVTEILLFGGLFCAFAIFRSWHLDAFVEAHNRLDKVLGGVNTVVLICSSLTMALAIRAAQTNNRKLVGILLGITLACAAGFMVIKGFEYHHKWHDGLLPGRFFNPVTPFENADANIFFGIYFMMTGIHGFHVLIGMGLITWLLVKNVKGHFSSRYYTPLEGVGLYWHLVDLIWIYLFPLVYLVG